MPTANPNVSTVSGKLAIGLMASSPTRRAQRAGAVRASDAPTSAGLLGPVDFLYATALRQERPRD